MSGLTYRTGYMDRALFDLDALLSDAEHDLRDANFDTLIGTGFSGGLVVPALALRLGKQFALLRKDSDDSHHGSGRLLGSVGSSWLFVDDFTSSGDTRRRVLERLAYLPESWDMDQDCHETVYVGDYLYAINDPCDRYRPYGNRRLGCTCAYENAY